MDVETGSNIRLTMSSNTTFDCNPGCKSHQHAAQLISSITKGSSLQARLFLSRCHNPGSITDDFGRSSLHVAASCGRDDVVEWLITEQGASVNALDHESGWTALHRALYYGQLSTARLLLAHDSNLCRRDREGLTPLDIVMKDRLPHIEFLHTGLDELFAWGANFNFTLGHENMQPRKLPEQVEIFRKQGTNIKKVAMSKYHSIFLTDQGHAYTCGHGLGGRLGQADEQTYLVPRIVDSLKKEVCSEVAAATNHSLFLMENGSVYSCGLNSFHQLGQFPPPEKSPTPKQVNGKALKGRQIIGICARRFHSVFYTSDTIFTCGLNAGQLGHYKVGGENLVSQPRPVTALCHKDTAVQMVTASDAATVVVTTKGDVYALHEFQCRKIVSKWLDIVQVTCTGGHLDSSVDSKSLKEQGGSLLTVALLTSTGKVYLCQASGDCIARRCVWSIGRPLFVTHLALGENILALVTKDGEAFTAGMTTKSNQTQDITRTVIPLKESSRSNSFSLTLSDLVLKDDAIGMSLERVALVHRATAVWTDQHGSNISVLQSNPNASVTCIPCVRPSEMTTHLLSVLNDAHLDDSIHDVVLQVGSEKIPLHCYILTQRSEYFRSRIQSSPTTEASDFDGDLSPDVPPIVLKIDLRGRSPVLFRQLLQFIYCDSCDLVSPGVRFQFHPKSSVQTSNGKLSSVVVAVSQKSSKKSKKKGKQSTNQSKETPQEDGMADCNPVESLKEMAQDFGLKSLVKRLETVQYVNGYVVSVPGRNLPSNPLKFDRKADHSSDICIESEDGVLIKCHKCLLVSRLEYFRSMFSSAWIETSRTTTVHLPFPGEVLKIVIEFLYTDQCVALRDSSDTDLICRILVASDQLLIGRLKDQCEVTLARLLTLRNVCELLEFASVYYANQLVETCQQFVCINLAALLETRALDMLSDEVMDKLTEYYKSSVVCMCNRSMTPYSTWPDLMTLESLEKSFLDAPSRTVSGVATPGSGKKGGIPRRRLRSKSTEVNVDIIKQSPPTALDVICDDQETIVKETSIVGVDKKDPLIENKNDEQLSSPKVASLSKDASEKSSSSPVGLATPTKSPSQPSSLPLSHSVGSISEKPSLSLRDIMSEEMAKGQSGHEIGEQNVVVNSSRWPKKISQKERRKQSLVTPEKVESVDPVAHGEASTLSGNPWKLVEKVVSSFKDLMLTEEIAQSPVLAPTSTQVQKSGRLHSSKSESSRLSWGVMPSASSPTIPLTPGSPISEPGSPWHRSPKISESGRSETVAAAACFSNILRDEMVETQSLKSSEKKSLHLIQIEEQAMSGLLDFYRASENVHEHITVERVSLKNARPLWAATQRQSSSRLF